LEGVVNDKICVVTGENTGIGKATVAGLSRADDYRRRHLVVGDRGALH
jgi:NAD(P)-dependent dehydrogenase (short-subunit alcohol dehydrogenase family)